MTTADSEIRRHIRHLLQLSSEFYGAFRIEKHRGALWFLLNLIWDMPDEKRRVSLLRRRLRNIKHVFRENEVSDITTFLKYLRSKKLISLTLDGAEPKLTSKPRQYVTDGTEIRVTPKFHRAVTVYVESVVADLFDSERRDAAVRAAPQLMRSIYKFMLENYIGLWEGLLRQIASRAISDEDDAERFAGELVRSTEFFILLHVMWERTLDSRADAYFDQEQIWEWCRQVREIEDGFHLEHLERLTGVGILLASKTDGITRYRLDRIRHGDILGPYMSDLITIRPRLRAQLEPLLIDEPFKHEAH